MTEFEREDNLNRMTVNESVDKLLEISRDFEPSDDMPPGLISGALANRKRNRSPLIPLILVGASCVGLIAFVFATYRKAPSIAQRSKEIESFNSRKEISVHSKIQNDAQSSRVDSLAFNNNEAGRSSFSSAKKSLNVGGHRRRLARRRLSSIHRKTSKIALGEVKSPVHLKTYAAMWKTETVERNYSGVLATALIATQDEQDRQEGTFTFTPAIIDLPLKPGDTITTTEETQTAAVSTANYTEEIPK